VIIIYRNKTEAQENSRNLTVRSERDCGCLKLLKSSDYIDYNLEHITIFDVILTLHRR